MVIKRSYFPVTCLQGVSGLFDSAGCVVLLWYDTGSVFALWILPSLVRTCTWRVGSRCCFPTQNVNHQMLTDQLCQAAVCVSVAPIGIYRLVIVFCWNFSGKQRTQEVIKSQALRLDFGSCTACTWSVHRCAVGGTTALLRTTSD